MSRALCLSIAMLSFPGYLVCEHRQQRYPRPNVKLKSRLIVSFVSVLFGVPYMAINVSCTVQRWVSPRHDTVDPMLLPLGNPIKCHEEVISLFLGSV